ncbi:MAG: hypothetical protein ACT6RM_13220, partial [Sphingopyxis sp.]
RVILGTKAKVSPGDILRLIFKGGGLTKLPKGRVAGDYLDARQMQRLHALETRFDQDYARANFLMTAFDLLSKRLAFNKDSADDASDVVRRRGGRRKLRTRPSAGCVARICSTISSPRRPRHMSRASKPRWRRPRRAAMW